MKKIKEIVNEIKVENEIEDKSIQNRYEFVLLFEVENGNPNGNPDAGNMPRVDIETNKGQVTKECLNRHVRNYITLTKEGVAGNDIYVAENAVLNLQNKKAYDYLGIVSEPKKLPKDLDVQKKLTNFMCENFYDVRSFGAVMSTEVNCGKLTGPINIQMANSIDAIYPQYVSITRCAVTTEKDKEDGKNSTFGNRYIVPYALYRANGFISAYEAKKSGFSEKDLELYWEALENMFEITHSSARGRMASRKLIIFKHDSKSGNAKAHKLFESVTISRKNENSPARCYNDYEVKFSETFDGVTITNTDF